MPAHEAGNANAPAHKTILKNRVSHQLTNQTMISYDEDVLASSVPSVPGRSSVTS